MHDRLRDLVGDRLEQLDLVAAILARLARADVERALEHLAAHEDRHGQDRLVLVLLQVRELLEARVEMRRGRDHHGGALGGGAAGDALADAHARAVGHLVDARPVRRAQHELVRPRVVEVDEAGVGAKGVRDLLGHEMEHLFEVERRVDGGRRLGQKPQMPFRRVHAHNGAWHPAGCQAPLSIRYEKNMKSAVCTGPVPSFNAISNRRHVPAQLGSVCQP